MLLTYENVLNDGERIVLALLSESITICVSSICRDSIMTAWGGLMIVHPNVVTAVTASISKQRPPPN